MLSNFFAPGPSRRWGGPPWGLTRVGLVLLFPPSDTAVSVEVGQLQSCVVPVVPSAHQASNAERQRLKGTDRQD